MLPRLLINFISYNLLCAITALKMSAQINRVRRLEPEKSVLFICDVQERFRSVIWRSETIIRKASFMYDSSQLLEIPCIVTEQYPKAFGKTVPDISLTEESTFVIEKKKFSMMTEETQTHFESLNKPQVILCGLEAHVCVLQTALELIGMGIDVFIVCDAVSSQRPYDRTVALQQMRDAGAVLTTTESAIFDLLRDSNHPNFKPVSALLKEHNALPNEFAMDTSI